MATPDDAPLRYLSAADVLAAMPDLDARLDLAEQTMIALVADAELPAKIGVHPRPADSLVHAMPAYLRGADDAGRTDRIGMKWVAVFPSNNAIGLPAIHGLVILNDATTGRPRAILDGGPITALRTAAISGAAIRRFAPVVAGRAPRAAIIGAGVQGRGHLAVLGRLLPGVALTLFDRHPDRVEALAEQANTTDGIGTVEVAADARSAIEGADVVVTTVSFGPVRQVMTSDWLTDDALVVPVDYATFCAADVARRAALFLVDDRDQFLANRDAGLFDDYPDPTATLGEAFLAGTPRPPSGRVVATHLGVGLADVILASAILERAESMGLGVELP
jgi:ornithine cyclodeaminase/alanine dehydrogenase-like protein (mu-crystallin family)